MKEINEHTPGSFCWVELATTDHEAAKKFYCTLFDWEFFDSPAAPGMIYTLLQLEGKDVAALYKMDDAQKAQGVPPNWLSYVSTKSVEESMSKVQSLGGSVCAGPIDVMALGRLAILQDPTGATFAVWQPGKHIGARFVNEPRTFCWNELLTSDDGKATEFYSGLFGWGRKMMDFGPGKYTVFQNGERPAAGMMKIPAEWGNVPPHWLVYFAVEDCEQSIQKATDLGAGVISPPQDVPGTGRFAILQDPQGASFAVIKLLPM